MTRSVWRVESANGVEYLVVATPQEVETAIRQYGMTGWCDCSLVEEIIEKSKDFRVCAICGRKLD